MTKEQQDLAWACLPKEVRENIRNSYNDICEDNEVVVKIFLEEIYGHHNLTSDTEPEEMLMVERKKVIRKYKFAHICDKDHPDKKYWEGAENTLIKLFGDKCLPDKEKTFNVDDVVVYHPFKTDSFYDAQIIEIRKGQDKPYLLKLNGAENIWAYPIEVQTTEETFPPSREPMKIDAADSLIAMAKDEMGISEEQPSVQGEPKFKEGDEIVVKYDKYKGLRGIIKGHCKYDDTWAVILNRYPYPINFTEEDIELYTKESMKENKREGWSEAFEKYAKEGEDEKLLPDHLDSEAIKALDDEKELNLCELLNLGDIIYNPTFGYGRVDLVNTDIKPYFCVSFEDAVVSLSFLHNGIEANSNSRPSIWPNEELYEKYPLDAYSAWMEWKEERNKKTWLRVNVFSEEGDVLIDKYIINITQKRSDQVVEEINKVLQKFHEKNSEE